MCVHVCYVCVCVKCECACVSCVCVTVNFSITDDEEQWSFYEESGDLHCEDPGFIVGSAYVYVCVYV